MNKKHFLLILTTVLCLCAGNAWGETFGYNFASKNEKPAASYANSDGVTFTFSGFESQQKYGLTGSGQFKLASAKTGTISWTGIASGGSINITEFSITAAAEGDNTWFIYTSKFGKRDYGDYGIYRHKGTSDNTVTLSSSADLSNLELGDYFVLEAPAKKALFVKSFSITYTTTPPTYQFQATALGPEEAAPKVSFTSGSFSETTVTDTQAGANIAATSASKTAYFSAPASYVDATSGETYYFEGWYRVNEDGITPSDYRHSDLTTCDSTFVSSSTDSSDPDILRLYAKYTTKYVPTFDFNLKFAVVGDGTHSDVFSTDCPLPLTSVTSSNESVATVSANLEEQTVNVSIVGRGRTAITISQTGDDDWVDKTVTYSLLVINTGEWIWQQDEVRTGLSYLVYDTVKNSGFMNTANPAGFDAITVANPTLWKVSGTWPSAYSLTANDGANEMAFCKPFSSTHIQTHNNEKSGDDLIITSSMSADGYYCMYRTNTFLAGGNRHAKADGNGKIVTYSDNCYEWVFVSPEQKAAYDSYVKAFDYVGDFSESNPELDTELRSVVGSNNFTSTNWVTCKANLDAIVAKCVDYDKFTDDELTITTTVDGFATFYSACAVELPNDVTAYKGSYSDGVLTLTDIDCDGKIPACTPVVLYKANTTSTSTITLTYDDGEGLSPVSGNKLHGSSYTILLSSSSVSIDGVSGTAYGLGQKDIDGDEALEAGFFKYSADATQVRANKAILVIDGDGPSLAAIRIFTDENTTTDIDMFQSSSEVTKFMENGQLFIKRDGIVYDVLGRIVK